MQAQQGVEAIPLIDVSCFCVSPTAENEAEIQRQRQQVVIEVHRAVKEIGFMYIKGLGVADVELKAEVARMFEFSHEFFAKDPEQKMELAWEPDLNIGYVAVERERLDPSKKGDLKEAFNIGNPKMTNTFWDLADKKWQSKGVNDIKARTADMKKLLDNFFHVCQRAARVILHIFALALELDGDYFENLLSDQAHTLRLLHYPPLEKGVAEEAVSSGNQTRAGEHSDYGCLTLLWQDGVGGLEVRNTNDEWLAAPCIENAIIVNTGDLIERWTNNSFKSTKHRVGIPKDESKRTQDRFSIAFFVHPNDETLIEPFPSCVSESRPPAYPPITAGEYLQQKLGKSY